MNISPNMIEIPSFESLKDATNHVVRQATLLQTNGIGLKKCGSLACQHNSFQRTLDQSRILSISQYQERSTRKKGKSFASKSGYMIVPNDSIFFPEGGGQPCDQGTLIIGENGSDVSSEMRLLVSDARNVDGICVLNCQPASTGSEFLDSSELRRIISQASDPNLSENDSFIEIKQELDWDRRFDFMTQHSAQHLISAEAFNLSRIETHSFSLQFDGASYIDLKVDPEMSLKEHMQSMKHVEEVVNGRIRENLPMTPIWLSSDDPEYKTKVRSRLLPEGLTGKIRLMEIGGGNVDCNTCCGTHVPSLGHLQMIKFFKMTKVKPNVMRMWFAAGRRLVDILQENADRQEQITALLSCSPKEHVARLEQLLADKRLKEKEIKNLNDRLCGLQAKEIAQECQASNGVAVLDLGPSADMSFMSQLSAAVLSQCDGTSKAVILLFVQGESGKGSFLLTGSDTDMVDRTGKEVARLLGGRGGGKNGRFQGKGDAVQEGLSEAKQLLIKAAGSP